jgi:hypothetical protein
VSDQSSGRTTWSVMELSAEETTAQGLAEAPRSPAGLVSDFLDWQFKSGAFDAAVFAGSKSNLLVRPFSGRPAELPQVMLASAMHDVYREVLQRAAVRGFELLVSSNSTERDLESFFQNQGYSLSSPCSVDSFTSAAWNRGMLEAALDVIARIAAQTVCCFAHDADPVYLLSLRK